MQEMRITPDLPVYAELIDKLFFALMDGQLETPEAIKAFLEPYSPPAPPPPIQLRRRPVKKEAKVSRAKKAPAKLAVAAEATDEPQPPVDMVEAPVAAPVKAASPAKAAAPAKAPTTSKPAPPVQGSLTGEGRKVPGSEEAGDGRGEESRPGQEACRSGEESSREEARRQSCRKETRCQEGSSET